MVYAIAMIPIDCNKKLKDLKVDDSKVLDHETRSNLFGESLRADNVRKDKVTV